MKTQIFNCKGAPIEDLEKRLPKPLKLDDPKDYQCSPELEAAVEVALIMRQPLIVTGEPGSGKTQLAYKVAHQLGLDVLKFETKSTSVAQDLFYTFNTLRRFHAVKTDAHVDDKDFITFRALGEAIICANPRENYENFFPKGFKYDGPKRKVVLIDEIDKAPWIFPMIFSMKLNACILKFPNWIPMMSFAQKPIVPSSS